MQASALSAVTTATVPRGHVLAPRMVHSRRRPLLLGEMEYLPPVLIHLIQASAALRVVMVTVLVGLVSMPS